MSDAILSVRRALEKHLAALIPSLGGGVGFAGENASFDPNGTWLEPVLLPATPDGSFISSLTYIERGVFQVSIMSPLGVGTMKAEALGAKVREAFKRGTTLTENGISVVVANVPAQARGYPDQGSWRIPVSIPWDAQVFN